jgi:iron complex transport system substrate-binding protein
MHARSCDLLASCLLLLAASCGGASETPAASAPRAPQRIVCANTAAAEFVCRLVPPARLAGLPEQVDDYAMFDARHGGFENVARFSRYVAEPVLTLRPDLVITHTWQSADTTNVLRSQGIEVLVLKSARSFEDIRETLFQLGARLGAEPRAADVVQDLDVRVAKLRAGADERQGLTAMVYSNDGTGGTTAGHHTTPDTMIRLAGLTNAAAEAGIEDHVQIDFERLIAINPDFLVVAAPARGESGSATKTVVESSAALAGLKARRPGHIIVLPAALMSADSPPLVDAAELLAREVDRALAGK